MTEDEKEVMLRDILVEAAARCAAIDGFEGMPMTVVIAYTTMDNEGDYFTGHGFSGPASGAIGLLEQAKYRILHDEEDE